MVDFMIKTYGRDKMTALLLDLKNGQTMDQALQEVYGFDTNGLENAWRTSIGAKPLNGSSQPTPVPTPTIIPTFVPISAAPVAVSERSHPASHPGRWFCSSGHRDADCASNPRRAVRDAPKCCQSARL